MNLKKGAKLLFVYFFILCNAFALEFLSSNGANYFKFNKNKDRIEKINLDFGKDNIDIEFIKIGFFIRGKQHEIGEIPYELFLSENSNIIELQGAFENINYKLSLYSSMLNKDAIVFHTKFLSYIKGEEISLYYYIKPREMGYVKQEKDYFTFNEIYFWGKGSKVYLTDNTEAKSKKLQSVEIDNFVSKNKGLFAIMPLELSTSTESYFTIQKNTYYKNTLEEEVSIWEKKLENYNYKNLYSNLFMFGKNDILVDISRENPLINMAHLNKCLELSLINKDYILSKKIMEFFIFSSKKIEGLVPSDYMDINGNVVNRRDNYGLHNSYYRRSKFLTLYLRYLLESDDKDFYNKTYPIVKERLIDWLESKITEKGIEPDSGNSRIGKDAYKAFVETQYEAYRSFKLLNQYFQKQGIKDDKYKKLSEKLKETLILYYVDGVHIADYPFAKEINPKNIFYVDEDLFLTQNEYYKALQKNIDLLKKEKSSLKEKVVFVNYLYDKKYYLMADFMREEIEKELKGDKGIELLQKDLELLLDYLIMKEKGEKYGLNK